MYASALHSKLIYSENNRANLEIIDSKTMVCTYYLKFMKVNCIISQAVSCAIEIERLIYPRKYFTD